MFPFCSTKRFVFMALMEYCVVNVCLGDYEFIKNTRNVFDYSYSNNQEDIPDRVRLDDSIHLLFIYTNSSLTMYFQLFHPLEPYPKPVFQPELRSPVAIHRVNRNKNGAFCWICGNKTECLFKCWRLERGVLRGFFCAPDGLLCVC